MRPSVTGPYPTCQTSLDQRDGLAGERLTFSASRFAGGAGGWASTPCRLPTARPSRSADPVLRPGRRDASGHARRRQIPRAAGRPPRSRRTRPLVRGRSAGRFFRRADALEDRVMELVPESMRRALHAANGAVRGGAAGHPRSTVRPSRSNKAPIVLAAGHDPRIAAPQPRPNLHRTPARIEPPDTPPQSRPTATADDNAARASVRQTRYPLQTIVPDAIEQQSAAAPEAEPFLHAGLLPNHRQDPPRRSENLLPMSPVYSVTRPDPLMGERGFA